MDGECIVGFEAGQRLGETTPARTNTGDALRARLAALIQALSADLIERDDAIRLSFLAALAGEHVLLIGPPGTAKSLLARRIHAAFAQAHYFERLLTRFTVPEELFGPLSIQALEQDRYERHIEGYLPSASIAFIDEVFKANSAILNALLTLLNEREFDNGAQRLRCPLISVLGATNEVPDDDAGAAFLDRFLIRLHVRPVSDQGFARLLRPGVGQPVRLPVPALDAQDRAQLARRARAVHLPETVLLSLHALRAQAQRIGVQASDRRWVKLLGLLRVAAASQGAVEISPWDLFLAPACLSPSDAHQGRLSDWLTQHLGVQPEWAPPRLSSLVQSFEAQLNIEQQANDLDYDDQGRLRFDPARADAELAAQVGDAKGGSAALRISAHRARRYGPLHIQARTGQIDAALDRLDDYRQALRASQDALQTYRARALWVAPALLDAAQARLDDLARQLQGFAQRLAQTRAGFEALPRLDRDPHPGVAPDPMPESLAEDDAAAPPVESALA
ncbi:MAG: hypothetical protein OHK0048_08170 [Rhodoferax sp.]